MLIPKYKLSKKKKDFFDKRNILDAKIYKEFLKQNKK